jgi:hypothetical protein
MPPRTHRPLTYALLLLTTALPLSVVAAGCGSASHGACDKACNCTGCSSATQQDCYNAADGLQKDADDDGCSSLFDNAASCYDSNLVCNGTTPMVAGCDTEIAQLTNCVGAAAVLAGSMYY